MIMIITTITMRSHMTTNMVAVVPIFYEICQLNHHSHDHSHDPGVSSVSIVCEGNLDLEKANMWLGTLLMEHSEDIYRMKGLLSVQGMNERFVFQ
ncbi:COBW domain-containing protein 2, partial [Trifolium medium]|nr:COBW domain-containing protein 2 [Trifolium medium]